MQQPSDLIGAWEIIFPGVPVPSDAQWAVWELCYPESTIRAGLAELGKKYIKLNGAMDRDYMLRFASSVMGHLSKTTRRRTS